MLPLSYGLEVIHFLEQHHRKQFFHQQHEQRTFEFQQQQSLKEQTEVSKLKSVSERHRPKPMELVFSGIAKSCPQKNILKDICGIAKPGEILAVMGPSGSGKTTLLGILSGRLKADSGVVTLNGETLNKYLRRKICYVLQQDIFFPNLTLKQTLKYTALLRLPGEMTKAEKLDFMEHLIDVLDLRHCLDTIIGDTMKRGLSGGERKRANIACELLTNPTMMLLDEPTTGLDSCTAFNLVEMLKQYAADERKTVVVSIHQPSSQIFYMFDRLLLLSNGQVVYFGSQKRVVRFFENLGLQMTPHYNPADFIMEHLKNGSALQERILIANQKLHECEEDGIQKSKLCPCFWTFASNQTNKGHPVDIQVTIDSNSKISSVSNNYANTLRKTPCRCTWFWRKRQCLQCSQQVDYGPRWPTSFWTQFSVLAQRNFMECRRRMLSKLNWAQTIGLGIISGLMWFQVQRKESCLFDIKGWMFFSSSYWMLFALFEALVSFPPENEVINKERSSGAYRLSAYYFAKMIGELPLVVTLPTVFHFISYPMLGFQGSSTFLSMWALLLLSTVVAQGMGLFIGASCRDMQMSVTISSLYSLSTMLFGGYYATTIPPWLSWLRYLSMVYYTFQNMLAVEFSMGMPVRCAEKNSVFEVCQMGNATYIPRGELLQYSVDSFPIWANTLVLFLFLITFRVLGYLVLRYIRKPK